MTHHSLDLTLELALELAIDQCLTFIQKNQQADGSFTSVAGDLNVTSERKTTFITSLILSCLKDPVGHNPVEKQIAKKAIQYILQEKSEYWSWNYWPRKSKKNTDTPIPDDLDDTFCALTAIQLHNPSLLDSNSLSSIVKILTSTEVQTGGPYNTWIVSDIKQKPWRDVDVVVNSNIAYFLKLLDIHIPSLSTLAEKTILEISSKSFEKNENLKSKYYTSAIPTLYFISRFYNGEAKDGAVAYILNIQKADGTWGNVLKTSMCITALINFGYIWPFGNKVRFDKAIQMLIQHAKTSNWPACACYIEESHAKPLYAGSATLTAALTYQSLFLYKNILNNQSAQKGRDVRAKHVDQYNRGEQTKRAKQDEQAEQSKHSKQQKLKQNIVSQVIDTFKHCSTTTKDTVLKTLNLILDYDKLLQVPLLAYFTYISMSKSVNISKKIDVKILTKLGTANTLGWLAYTLYDDVLDEDEDPSLLCIANIAQREVMDIYLSVFKNKHIHIFKKIMNKIDEANAWERKSCRFINLNRGPIYNLTPDQIHDPIQDKVYNPEIQSQLPDYKNLDELADKSFGHALPAIALFVCAGYAHDSHQVKNLISFFKHYIIAKQLNDDAHDWLEDLEKGFINSVSVRILKNYHKKYLKKGTGSNKESEKNKENEQNKQKEDLQKIFWYTTIDNVAEDIFTHLKKAEVSLQKITLFDDKSYYLSLLEPIRLATIEAIKERDAIRHFLSSYVSTTNSNKNSQIPTKTP